MAEVPRDPSLADVSVESLVESLVARCLERAQRPDESVLAEICASHTEVHGLVRERLDALERAGLLGTSDRAELPSVSPGPSSVLTAREDEPAHRASGTEVATHHLAEMLRRLKSRGESWERYCLEEQIATGGQGVVLHVRDKDLLRDLAMKVILGRATPAPHIAMPTGDARSLGRFLEEAQVTAQLDHPGIVPVHELGVDPQGRVYFTMKLVQGRSLKEIFTLVSRGEEGWSVTRAVGALQRVCEAMAYAHTKGVVHRDLKPGNVMVGRFGEVYVMDWGLAHVLGQEDRKDIRIRGGGLEVDGREQGPDSPLVTMDGDVIGTPSYMPPEQALGKRECIGPHSDVYSVGAMLYHLLTGNPPYVEPGTRPSNRATLYQVQKGPPTPLRQATNRPPPELIAICEKAMARDPADRFPDTRELADDLRAYLENRVVQAYETGAVAELRKWVTRNQALATSIAAGILILILGLISSWILKGKADGNAALAAERAIQAQANFLLAEERRALAEKSEQEARARRDEVMRLSAGEKLGDLIEQADSLWPALPDKLQAFERWLGDARTLVAGLDPSPDGRDRGHRARLAELRARALPQSAEEYQASREADPRLRELTALSKRIDSLDRAQAVREGRARIEEHPVDSSSRSASSLATAAHSLVRPDRTVFGEELRGLALARESYDRAESGIELAISGDALAWALLANGLDDEALDASEAAFESAPDGYRAEARVLRDRLVRAVEHARSGEELAVRRARRLALEQELALRRTWSFESDEDAWWHRQLDGLIDGITALVDPEQGVMTGISPGHGWGVARRREWAIVVGERTVTSAAAADLWLEAIRSISDPVQSPQYGGLLVEPQLGLLPLGKDRRSGLWEFALLQTGALPVRDDAGHIPSEENAIVFVLLPGGVFSMGAQSDDPGGRNYDPSDHSEEGPVHEVTLSPFFISKFEVTQAQWLRFTGTNPSFFGPHNSSPTWNRDNRMADLSHPVEQVSWNECVRFCQWLGLSLPTEAQWEYAARAGSSQVRWTGDDKEALSAAANLADHYAMTHEGAWGIYDSGLDDGNTVHARVGSYAPNPFGLHDVIGNVSEWCWDAFDADFYGRSPRSNPLNTPGASPRRVFRGGAFNSPPALARSACRPGFGTAEISIREMGFRPARALTTSRSTRTGKG